MSFHANSNRQRAIARGRGNPKYCCLMGHRLSLSRARSNDSIPAKLRGSGVAIVVGNEMTEIAHTVADRDYILAVGAIAELRKCNARTNLTQRRGQDASKTIANFCIDARTGRGEWTSY